MKNEPKIRIKGFEGEWKEYRSCDFFETFNERNRPDLPVLSAFQDIRGMAVRSESGYEISHDKRNEVTYKVVKPGQFVMHLRSFQGGFAHSSVEGITSPAYTVFGFKNPSESDDYYWKTIFMSPDFIDRLKTITYGIRDGRSISFEEFLAMPFKVPRVDEQRAIATYFRHIDSLIETADKKLASLKQVKEASLQSMFPKEGQKVPEVRFKGFEGEWKETRLGDIGNTYSGVGFPIEEQGGCIGTPFYKVSDMNKKGNEAIMKSSNNYVNENQVEKHGWKICRQIPAIFFAKVGAAVLLDRKRLVLEPCLCDNNTMLYCQNKDSWDPFFCLSLFETIKLSSLSQIGTLPSYNGSAVENLYIKIPSLPEQRKIASFFVHLDKQIAIAQQRLDLLRRIKSACLDEMFV